MADLVEKMIRKAEKAFINVGVQTAREVKAAAELKVSGKTKKARVRRIILELLDQIDIPWIPNFIEQPFKRFLVDVLIESFYKALKEFGVL